MATTEKVLQLPGVVEAKQLQEARADYQELWRELVSAKAMIADLRNERAAWLRELEELRRYCARHVKRIDGMCSRITGLVPSRI